MPLQSVWEAGSIHPAALSRPFAGRPLIAPLQDVCNIIRVVPISRDDPDASSFLSALHLLRGSQQMGSSRNHSMGESDKSVLSAVGQQAVDAAAGGQRSIDPGNTTRGKGRNLDGKMDALPFNADNMRIGSNGGVCNDF